MGERDGGELGAGGGVVVRAGVDGVSLLRRLGGGGGANQAQFPTTGGSPNGASGASSYADQSAGIAGIGGGGGALFGTGVDSAATLCCSASESRGGTGDEVAGCFTFSETAFKSIPVTACFTLSGIGSVGGGATGCLFARSASLCACLPLFSASFCCCSFPCALCANSSAVNSFLPICCTAFGTGSPLPTIGIFFT